MLEFLYLLFQDQRRMDVEQKIQQKVKDEEEKSIEEQKRAFQEQKEKELALREEVVQQLEQKALELLVRGGYQKTNFRRI